MVMKTFLSGVRCSDAFGMPQNLEAQVIASGKFYDFGEKVRDMIAEGMQKNGLYVSNVIYSGGFQENAGILYSADEEDQMIKVHEEFHERFAATEHHDKSNYEGVAYTYFKMFEEAFAKALEYSWFLDNPGEHKVEDIENTVNIYSERGEAAYNLCMNINAIEPKIALEKTVAKFMDNSFINNCGNNWLSLVLETQYFGLFGPCFDLVWENENAEELMHHGCALLAYDETGEEFLKFLNEESEDKRGMIGPLFEKTVQKSLYEYRNGDEKFQIIFIAPRKKDVNGELNFLRDIQEEVRGRYEGEFSKIGESGSRIWANYLKIRS